nr:MAG TPA_asm: hypothetical protein [Caudoviricetes sp.]
MVLYCCYVCSKIKSALNVIAQRIVTANARCTFRSLLE